MSVSTDLGKVAITNGGEWSSSNTYEALTVVSANGSGYISKKAVPSGIAITNTEYWQLLASKGEQGEQGETGATGPAGPQGPQGQTGQQGSQGNSVYVRYSAYPDGTDFTETRSEGQIYIGLAVGQSAPTVKTGYDWGRFFVEDYGGESEDMDE